MSWNGLDVIYVGITIFEFRKRELVLGLCSNVSNVFFFRNSNNIKDLFRKINWNNSNFRISKKNSNESYCMYVHFFSIFSISLTKFKKTRNFQSMPDLQFSNFELSCVGCIWFVLTCAIYYFFFQYLLPFSRYDILEKQVFFCQKNHCNFCKNLNICENFHILYLTR